MAGEFADLLNLDFGSAGEAASSASQGAGNLDVGTVMPANADLYAQPSGGFNFSDLAQGAKDVGSAVKGGAEAAGGAVKGVLEPFGAIAKTVSPFVGLATGGMNIAAGIQANKRAAEQAKMQREAQRMQGEAATATRAAAQPLTDFGKEQLDLARAGNIPPAIQAKINEWKTGYLAAIRDRLARMGQGDSQAMMQWEQWVDQQAKAMEAQYLQEEQRLGMQGLTQGAQTLASSGGQAGAVAQGAAAEQGGIDRLMAQANEMLAKLNSAAA